MEQKASKSAVISGVNEIKLMIGTNPHVLEKMQKGEFRPIVWASDNLATVAHYYEGCVIELTVELVEDLKQQYVASVVEILEIRPKECIGDHIQEFIKGYTWGCDFMKCPAGATWYSFSSGYLREHLRGIKEIRPNLDKYFDEVE